MSQEQASSQRIRNFKDIVAWQKAHKFTVEVYRATARFPQSEQFGLTNQIRRSAVSIASNIAEGFGRRTSADRIHFYDIARASLHESQAQLLIARDVGLLPNDDYDTFEETGTECHKLLTGLINKTKSLDS